VRPTAGACAAVVEDWGRWAAVAARWATVVTRFWVVTGQVGLAGPTREEGKDFDFFQMNFYST
jgi:hypothetical protein